MPNRAPLGGSPLGLIGLKSAATDAHMSTFNGGVSRNVNVDNYNKSRGGTLFTGKRNIRAWPNIKKVNDDPDVTGNNDVNYKQKTDSFIQKTLHSDSVYDTSILNIIEQLSNTKAQLKPADFAYLKNIGVYPNNRLMVARRFATPMGDNIMYKKKANEMSSLAALISWVPENQDFLDISFGEEWMDAEADFKGLLNSLGSDVSMNGSGGNAGGVAGAFGNAVPLPGFTEIFQRQVLEALGLFEPGSGDDIPAGNPNLIKQAKRRKTVGYSEAGSGLACTVNIKMTCEYELKFISGIDPTIVWMDLIGTIVRFGTSESSGYGLGKTASSNMIKWANNPNTLVSDFMDGMSKAIDKLKSKLDDFIKFTDTPDKTPTAEEKKSGALDFLTNLGNTVLKGLVLKYRVRLIGIINALSGLPSTPWHITIGNPMRPVFCSGDMLTQNVNLRLGPTLAFNDLPMFITAEFTLTNARPWGMQEIMAKFNSGYLRTVDVQKSFYETKKGDLSEMAYLPLETPSPINTSTGGTQSNSQVSSSNSQSSQSNASGAPGATQSTAGGGVTNVSNTNTESKSTSLGGQNANTGVANNDPQSSQPVIPTMTEKTKRQTQEDKAEDDYLKTGKGIKPK